jgi:hypothetical protein
MFPYIVGALATHAFWCLDGLRGGMMIVTRRHPSRPRIMIAWILIWFGTILVVNPRDSISRVGVLLWSVGIVLQLVSGGRWLLGRSGSGPSTIGPAAG